MNQYIIRDAKGADLNFIYDTWLNSYRNSEIGLKCGTTVFFDNYRFVLDQIFEKSKILIACLPDNEDVILGYASAAKPDTLHYVFVKEAFRRLGISNALIAAHELSEPAIAITHTNEFCRHIAKKKHLYYNPFKLYQTNQEK